MYNYWNYPERPLEPDDSDFREVTSETFYDCLSTYVEEEDWDTFVKYCDREETWKECYYDYDDEVRYDMHTSLEKFCEDWTYDVYQTLEKELAIPDDDGRYWERQELLAEIL